MAKSYGYFCSLAQTLDVMGDRWTPLVLRELAFGGRRFSDLLEGLPGVNATLLSQRLKHLAGHGVVERRRLPAPVASVVYELTEDGKDLANALVPLARWGARRLKARKRGQTVRSRSVLFYLQAVFRPEEARGVEDVYEVRVGEEVFRLWVADGTLRAEQVLEPGCGDLALEADLDTLTGLATGQVDFRTAVADGRLGVFGDRAAARRFRRIFARPEPRG